MLGDVVTPNKIGNVNKMLNKIGNVNKIPVICHMDISAWTTNHMASNYLSYPGERKCVIGSLK